MTPFHVVFFVVFPQLIGIVPTTLAYTIMRGKCEKLVRYACSRIVAISVKNSRGIDSIFVEISSQLQSDAARPVHGDLSSQKMGNLLRNENPMELQKGGKRLDSLRKISISIEIGRSPTQGVVKQTTSFCFVI